MLKNKKYNKMFKTQKLLENLVNAYRNKEYLIDFKGNINEEICNIINKNRDDSKFIMLLKRYEIYSDNSKWCIRLINTGKSSAYDFFVTELGYSSIDIDVRIDKLDVGKSKNIQLTYFDKSIRINNFDIPGKEKLDYGFSTWQRTKFYLVKCKNYNNKDEKILKVTYKDSYSKEHSYFICATTIKINKKRKKH